MQADVAVRGSACHAPTLDRRGAALRYGTGAESLSSVHRRVAGRAALVQKDRFSSARLRVVSGDQRLAGRAFAAPSEVICDLHHPALAWGGCERCSGGL